MTPQARRFHGQTERRKGTAEQPLTATPETQRDRAITELALAMTGLLEAATELVEFFLDQAREEEERHKR